MTDSDLQSFKRELRNGLRGEVYFDEMSRYIYSTDASLYRIQPLAVAVPRDEDDVRQIVQTADQFKIPILPRGGGTSLAGQTVTNGVVLDFSKYMNQVLELNAQEKWVRVQPGIVLDQLNHYLEPHGLFFAPDVATSSRANIGGMIGNNSSGVRSIRYGKTVDHVLELKTILASGMSAIFHPLDRSSLKEKLNLQNHEGQIYRGIQEIIKTNRDLIQERFPSVMRRVSGYNLDLLVNGSPLNLSQLIVGSEGTLALVTEARLKLESIPHERIVLVLHYSDLFEAIESVPGILHYHPTAVEVLDDYGLQLARENPAVASHYKQFIRGQPKAILIVEMSANSPEDLQNQVDQLLSDQEIIQKIDHTFYGRSPESQSIVWQVRKNALGVMLGIKGDFKPLPFIEDSCVPVDYLAEYVSKIKAICDRYGRRLALYAHASVGVIHLRPILNLKQEKDLEILQSISQEAFQLVVGYQGAWSGEHGDGLVRSYKLKDFFGADLYEALRQVKALFDPDGLMNPGKIIDPPPMTESLRIHPGYQPVYPRTFYRFEDEGGFDRAVEMCTGVGQCRKTLAGVMCPSFIATGDEEHSTRGRANALRGIIAGEMTDKDFSSERLYQVMDLCLECKACKSECPSSVDMAKMKAEFLAHYYLKNGLPLGKKLVASTRQTAKWASSAPRLANAVMNSSVFRLLLEKLAGFDRRRTLPFYSNYTFSQWFDRRDLSRIVGEQKQKIVLFADTFTDFYEPRVGISAISILERMGFEVILGKAGCCGRPLISAGQLQEAKRQGAELIKKLSKLYPEVPILVLEPSCYSTFKDDYLDLIEDRELTREVVERMISFEELIERFWPENTDNQIISSVDLNILVHGHCQQKAILGSEITVKMLQKIPGAGVQEVPAGCCGMAGSFGYENDHYAISERIARRHLIPAIENASRTTEIAVSGFSCRSQIRHFTNREVHHPVEILARHLTNPKEPS